MQNWNQWQLSAGAVASPMPQPPVGYAAPGADPLAVMQAYMQYYNQPAPSGYTAEQWAAAQQQNWAQWQQWQQQYQQWQAQYGEKYQETIKHMSAQNVGLANQVPPLPIVQPPPLPKEDAKPPLPPSTINTYQFTSMPPPHQNNLPLFPVKQNANSAIQPSVQSCPQNPPLPSNQPPLPPENSSTETVLTGKRSSNTISESSSAKKLKVEDEELTEAEKTFDAQFKQWEEQFNKWKQQNANHPDKTQYKQYEAKWTSWREKLIERREQMRRKREQQKQAAVKAEAEKNKSLPGDDKILNLLSSTENQGLINNLLGIGKTLGLTGKQNTNVPPPPPPPPPPPSTQTTVSTVQTTTITPFTQVTSQPTTTQLSGGNIMSSHMNSSSWNSQQWTPQYNPAMSVSSFPGFHSISAVPPPPFGMPPPNFSQPPPNFSAATPNFSAATPNFSQPPPGFPTNDMRQLQNLNTRPPIPSSLQGSTDTNLIGQNERSGQSVPPNSFDPVQSSNYGINDQNRQKDLGAPSERFGRDGINKNLPEQQGNQFRPKDSFAPRNENYKLNDERVPETEHFKRDDRNYKEHGNSQFTPQKANFASSNDRFVHGNERFGLGNDHCGSAGDRFGHANDRFGSGNDRFGNNRFGVGNDRTGSGNDRFGPGTDRIESNNDRFSASNDRFGTNSEHFGPGNDRFNRSNLDRFDQKDTVGNRRDSFLNNPRSFNRNNQFEPPDKLAPELKKLMEKRRAAMDVFKPSFLDSDKSSSVGSLSESFKRIAGDSPFIMKSSTDFTQKEYSGGKGNNFVPCGTSNFSSTGSNSFRMPVDFKSQVGSEFGSRSSTGFGSRNNTFDLRDGPVPPFKGPISSPQHILNSIDCKPDTTNLGNNVATDKDNLQRETVQELSANKNDAPIAVEQAELNELAMTDQKVDDTGSKDRPEDCQLKKDIPLLEKPPWLDAQLPDTLPRKEEKNATEGESIPANFGKPLEQCSENTSNVPVGDKKHLLSSDNDSMSKKSDVLPFMGENDPKPEDLNMEPPPELPNLGPVTTGATSGVTDSVQKPDASFDVKGPPVRSFPINSECFNSRPAFDGSIGPRAMQFRPNVPSLFSPRGPNDGRFPMFEPRGSNAFPFPSPGPSSHQLGPRPPNDGPFAPRNPNDGHFGQRGPNDGQFGPRGPSDGHFGPRGPNDGQFMPRGPNDGQFVPRGPNDGQFSIRGPNDGLFGPRGPNDAQFVPRGPNDAQFGPRGPNDAQFGPRGPTDVPFVPHGSSNRQFAPARPGDIPFDNRGSTDAQFGPRGSSEGQSGFPGSNVERFFGSRGSSDGSPYQRGSNDNVFGPRGVNDIQFPSRNSMDGPYGPRNFNDRQFDTPNDGHHGPQGTNDRYLGGRNMPGGPIDAFNSRLPFGARGPGEFRARGQFDNSCPKTLREGLNEKHLERSIETGGADIRGNGGSDTGKSTVFDVNDKMQNEKGLEQRQPFDSPEIPKPGWRQSYTKNSFGDTDQRSVQSPLAQTDVFNQSSVSNVEQRPTFAMNKPNILTEKRPEKNTTDSGTHSSIGDFSNMFMKRPIDNRQSQMRCPPVKEFCIEKQFNYNHGGATPDKKFIEHVPVKIIDYAHTSRSSMQDYLTPVQCFDYGHGNLKPAVSDRETQPKKDFRHWEENEQNLKDYTERIRRYEYFVEKEDTRRSVDYNQRRDGEGSMDERRSDRERREKEDYKVKERGEDRMFDRVSDKDHNSRYKIDKSNSKERTQERCDTSQKEANKENNKDEDRSKGNINWQDSPNKNITEIKPQDTSVPDTQHNVLESAPKTLELAKTPNCTMVDDLLCPPGRQNRPPKIAIILRGPPGSGKSFVAKLIKDKEVEQGGSAPRILSLDDYFLVEKEIESKDDNGKKVIVKDMVYEYEEAMEPSYITSLVKAFKKNITDGFFNFIILDCINEKISDYEEMWSFAKTKGFKVYVCEMEMDVQICLKRNIHNRTEEEINRIIDYFEPTPSYHQKLDVNSMLQEQAIEEVHMEDSEEIEEKESPLNEDSQDSQDDAQDMIGVSKWERMEADDKLDRLDGLAKKKNEGKVQTMKDFLQVPDYYNMEDTSGKKRVRWADLEERKEQEKMRAVGFVVGHTNWDRMMDPTKGGSALTRTKFFSLS